MDAMNSELSSARYVSRKAVGRSAHAQAQMTSRGSGGSQKAGFPDSVPGSLLRSLRAAQFQLARLLSSTVGVRNILSMVSGVTVGGNVFHVNSA